MKPDPRLVEGEGRAPLAVLVMGVSGAGKSTLARALADALNARFLDADDFHPPENIGKMSAGQALDDADRALWLKTLNQLLRKGAAEGADQVLACSALKSAYRRQLREGLPVFRVVFLHGSRSELERRLRQRAGHFMPASLLDSQLEALEAPSDPNTIHIPLHQPLEAAVAHTQRQLASH